MKPPRQLVGTGITQREHVTLLRMEGQISGDGLKRLVWVYENPEMAGQTSWGGMANFVEDTRQWAAEVLTEAGLPSSYGRFWPLADGSYRDVAGLSWKEYCALTNLHSPPPPADLVGLVHLKGLQPDSPAGYAARLLALLWRLNAASGNLERSVELAFEFGYLARECSMKFRWERHALHGQKKATELRDIATAANARRKSAAAQKRAEWQELANALFATKPGESKLWAADEIRKKTGALENRNTIAGRIKKPPKAG